MRRTALAFVLLTAVAPLQGCVEKNVTVKTVKAGGIEFNIVRSSIIDPYGDEQDISYYLEYGDQRVFCSADPDNYRTECLREIFLTLSREPATAPPPPVGAFDDVTDPLAPLLSEPPGRD